MDTCLTDKTLQNTLRIKIKTEIPLLLCLRIYINLLKLFMIGPLTTALERIDIPADWIGIRAIQEASSFRAMRDGHPQRNERSLNRGARGEVLAQGQFGYSATNQLTEEALRQAMQRAYKQAIAASKWAIHYFTQAVRPPITGSYRSPYQKPFDSLDISEINDLLRRLCEHLKVSAAIVRTSAIARTYDIAAWFVSTNGSQIHQRTGAGSVL